MKHSTAVKERQCWHAGEVQAAGEPILNVLQGLVNSRIRGKNEDLGHL